MFASQFRYQLLATLCANINTVSFGAVCGWPAPSFPVLLSNETPLSSGQLTIEQISWVGAYMCVGSFFGNSLFTWMTDKYGRKIPLMISAIPNLLGWVLIIMATNPMYLYISRFLGGFAGGGVFVILPMFVAEISDDKVRGSLGSLLVLSCNIGILSSFVLGHYIGYIMTPMILVMIPIAFLLVFVFFPESPQFLMKKGRIEEAEKSLKFYRNIKEDVNEESGAMLTDEIVKLKKMYQLEECNEKTEEEPAGLSCCDFCTPSARKAFLIGFTLIALCQFCGCFAMLNYTAAIFAESGSDLSPNMATIIVGLIQIVGANCSTCLVDRAGRKFLIAVSAIGTGIGLTSLGLYTRFKSMDYNLDGLGWIPVASFSFAIFIANWGVMTLPFLVITEIMPEKIRAFGTSLCMSLLYIFGFIMLKCFPLFTETLGMDGSMFLFSGVCFSGALFVIFVLPETKGKSFDEIMKLLEG